MSEDKSILDHLANVKELLAKHKLVEELVHRQDMPRHDLVEEVVHKQHLAGMRTLLERIPLAEIAQIIEALEPED
ncbi:MAG: magnesium transporter, partial [Propionivibrio sp.]|nr:magnesium transporter [Propionivibrio sp.]